MWYTHICVVHLCRTLSMPSYSCLGNAGTPEMRKKKGAYEDTYIVVGVWGHLWSRRTSEEYADI